MLLALTERGWEVTTLCGCGLDFQKPEAIRQLLADRSISIIHQVENSGTVPFSLTFFHDGMLKSSVFLPKENLHVPSQEAGSVFLDLLHEQILQVKPDILITYGGYWVGKLLLRWGHEHRLKNVVLLQNLVYSDSSYFHDVDLTIVPSQFASDHYTEKLGLTTTTIPPMMDWSVFHCEPDELSRQYVTFINPEPGKGVYVFVQIAKQLWTCRPDIPLLVVEGRAGADWLARTGVDLRGVGNMNLMANTPDPRDFYRVTKIMLIPSLFMESFGRVAAEAMINGIPVIGSNRGALPEVIGDASLTLDIPAQYTPETRIVPTP
jgi:glycosyltransferase involved in cell wall biosynthesis